MKYRILEIQCELSNGGKATMLPACTAFEQFCDDLEHYRQGVIAEINMRLSIMGVKVDAVYLRYEEQQREDN